MSSKEGLTFNTPQKKGIFVALTITLVVAVGVFIGAAFFIPQDTSFAFPKEAITPIKQETAAILLDVNIADTSQFVALRGIGPVLARRIVNYRDVMGGFSSIDQIANVYGIKPEVFEEIKGSLYTNSSTIPASAYNTRSVPQQNVSKEILNVDINIADAEDFAQLPGIGKVLSQRIINYRNALGGFEETSQISKVFNLKPEVFERVVPYLYVDPVTMPAWLSAKQEEKSGQPVAETPYPSDKPRRSGPIASLEDNNAPNARSEQPLGQARIGATRSMDSELILDLNMADSAQLVQLPGIGTKLAPRIVRYRRMLGYFKSLSQLKNVYGLSETNYLLMTRQLRIGDTDSYPRKDLNASPAYRLAGYPSISRQLSEAIVKHRKQLGWYESWDQVAMVDGMTPEALAELKSYFEM